MSEQGWKRDLDNWLMASPPEAVECPDCGDDGEEPSPDCQTCDGTGWVGEDALRMQAYDRAEAERAEEWRNEQ